VKNTSLSEVFFRRYARIVNFRVGDQCPDRQISWQLDPRPTAIRGIQSRRGLALAAVITPHFA